MSLTASEPAEADVNGGRSLSLEKGSGALVLAVYALRIVPSPGAGRFALRWPKQRRIPSVLFRVPRVRFSRRRRVARWRSVLGTRGFLGFRSADHVKCWGVLKFPLPRSRLPSRIPHSRPLVLFFRPTFRSLSFCCDRGAEYFSCNRKRAVAAKDSETGSGRCNEGTHRGGGAGRVQGASPRGAASSLQSSRGAAVQR